MRVRGAASLAAALALVLALPAPAKIGAPGLSWFAGHYHRLGRDGATPPRRLYDNVTLEFRGDRIQMVDCDGRRMQLIHDPSFDYADLLTGVLDDVPVDCRWRNNGANRPVLTCTAADGAAFTLWPLPEQVGTAKGTCAP